MSNKGVWNKVTVECMVSLNNNNGKKKMKEKEMKCTTNTQPIKTR